MNRILVVDDDAEQLFLLQTLLEKNGYQVATLGRASVATKVVEAFSPQVILLDIKLVELDGRDICMELKKNNKTKHIKIILYSGYNITKDEYELYGADDFISKSVNPKDLLKKIEVHAKSNIYTNRR
ncbi:MAG TPA: response regulator [Panacibacter sp.]|nr:response regulator [Panacibacter sp.]